tara:strand:- start:46 stop:537 length:492 start_codon:yes stop_codon:yes gene_type:complete
MPYIWNKEKEYNQCVELWPYSSLPNKGFALFILITFLMLNFPLYTLLGTKYFWVIFTFLFIMLAAVWYALRKNYKDRNILEKLTITADLCQLIRQNPDGKHQSWECNRYWTKVSLHVSGGPVPNYITLSGSGRVVEIGSFLSEPERKDLYHELVNVIKKFQSN